MGVRPDSEVILASAGYGLPYHLGRTDDPIVWLAFFIGDLNFLAALGLVFYLVLRRKTILD